MNKKILTGAALGIVAALAVAAPAQARSSTEADLSVLHGIPGQTVDVWVNGDRTLDDFTPGTLAGPLELAAGDYTVVVTAPDATDASTPLLGLQATLTLEANTSYTATANLDASGTPALNLFTNDVSRTAAGEGRLTVRHIAAAPAVDILAGDTPVIEGLENPREEVLDLKTGTVSASVAAAGTTDPLLGPTDVRIADGKNVIVYAWGSLDDDNLALAVQTVTVPHTSPSGVNTGTGGMAAEQDTAPLLWGSAALLALAGLAVGVTRRVRRAGTAR